MGSRRRSAASPIKGEINAVLSAELIDEIRGRRSGYTTFFRGHSKVGWAITPSLFRNDAYYINERKMIKDVLTRNPDEFVGDKGCLERLARLQHYGLPTRIMDVTTSLLVGMYFCCSENIGEDGELVVIDIDNERVKLFDSDSVSCCANISGLHYDDKEALADYIFSERKRKGSVSSINTPDFNQRVAVGHLHHLICEEKPHFKRMISPVDLYSVKAVFPRLTNRRLVSQSGAFLIFGILKSLDDDASSQISIRRLKISAKNKQQFLDDLDVLGVNAQTLFPEIDRGCEYIRKRVDRPLL